MGKSGFSFSRKIPKNFYKDKLIPILEEKIKDHEGIFVICRSRIADISFEQIIEELEKILKHYKSINEINYFKKKNIVMVKQKKAH